MILQYVANPCKNNAFVASERGNSENQSKPWRHGEHSYKGAKVIKTKMANDFHVAMESFGNQFSESVKWVEITFLIFENLHFTRDTSYNQVI